MLISTEGVAAATGLESNEVRSFPRKNERVQGCFAPRRSRGREQAKADVIFLSQWELKLE